LDREIRVGVPARRADGSGRRTAGRWVAPPAVGTVRFTRPSGRRTRLSRARLGKAAGVPRGADDPQGPNRPGAGGSARRPLGRGSWGLSFSAFGPSSPGARARIGHRPRRDPPSSIRRTRSPQATARPRPRRPTCPPCWQSTWQSVVARRRAGSGPVVAHHASVAPVRRGWLTGSRPGGPAVTAQRP
jgi:hypothetical protein